jgi:diguanylate cyclase (GGDEF)-like protein/putative nucleotidyltransferase with HDIG domain
MTETAPAWANPLLRPDPHTSGLTSRLILSYVEREAGRPGVEALLNRCGLTAEEARLRDPTFWFDFETKIALFEAAGAVLGQADPAWRIGQAAIELQALTGIKIALRAFGTPRLAYGAAAGVNGRFTRTHRMELLALDDDSARFRYSDVAGVGYHPVDCQYTAGMLSCAPTMFGGLPADVRHPTCALRGASWCVYEVTWERRASVRSQVALGLGVGATALAGARSHRGRRALAVPLAGAGVAAHRSLKRRRQSRRSLEAEVRDHQEASERLFSSLRDLVSELRTDDVLEKIMDNAQTALLGREAVVLVSVGEEVRAHGSAGVPADALRGLERWASGSFERLDQPRTLPDLASVPELADLAAHAETPLCALSAAPLAFRGSRLGALVALSRGADAFLPKEIALLEVYAAEAAIALANARLVERLEGLARCDSLTGLLNHGEFQETLARELEGAQRRGETLSVAMLDLDGFKGVNDEYGHPEGDRVLSMVADEIRAACGPDDTAARVGGDEFALILPRRTTAEAEALTIRLEREIVSFGVGTGVSSGVAEWPKAGPSQSLLLFNADRALYEAKVARRAEAERASGVPRLDPATSMDPDLNVMAHRRGLTAALARAVDAKDSYTRSHCETVAELSAAIARELGFEPSNVLKLRLAGLLHDVGKIGIADAILQKPAKLTDEEFEIMKTHAALGHSILYAAELFDESQWVLHHHERIDGRGYPDGLCGDDVPLESRIILVADAFEAMTSDRPYRRGRPEADALEELERHAGTQFDPECVVALKQILRGDPQWSAPADGRQTLRALDAS